MKEIIKEITLSELATLLSIDVDKIGITDIDDLGLEIMTPNGFKSVSSYVVKEKTEGYQCKRSKTSSWY